MPRNLIFFGKDRSKLYPIITYPNEFTGPAAFLPKIPNEPLRPSIDRPTDKDASWETWWGAIISLVVGLFSLGGISVWPPIIVFSVVVVFFSLYQFKHIFQIPEKYESAMKVYNEKWNEYHVKKSEYNQKLKMFKELSESKEILHKYFLEWCLSIPKPNIYCQSKKGIAENKFIHFLRGTIDEECIVDHGIEILHTGRTYIPDITIIENVTGAMIDVEIDEPYTLDSGQPIHYEDWKGVHSNDARDRYFNNKGWIVVRFSESQICNFPQDCVNLIKWLCECIRKYPYRLNFVTFTRMDFHSLWTYDDSIALSNSNFRESYLHVTPNPKKKLYDWFEIKERKPELDGEFMEED
jgi:hypothetical protein